MGFGDWSKKDTKSCIGDKISFKYCINLKKNQSVSRTNLQEEYKEETLVISEKNILNYKNKKIEIKLIGYDTGSKISFESQDLISGEKLFIDLEVIKICYKKHISSNEEIAKLVKSESSDIEEIKKKIKSNTLKQ